MTPVGLPAGETPTEVAQSWKCTVCQTEQVGLVSRGCTHCGAGSQQPFKAAPVLNPPPGNFPGETPIAGNFNADKLCNVKIRG